VEATTVAVAYGRIEVGKNGSRPSCGERGIRNVEIGIVITFVAGLVAATGAAAGGLAAEMVGAIAVPAGVAEGTVNEAAAWAAIARPTTAVRLKGGIKQVDNFMMR
jgi:hypothetical protein